jgi:hypothetical protein
MACGLLSSSLPIPLTPDVRKLRHDTFNDLSFSRVFPFGEIRIRYVLLSFYAPPFTPPATCYVPV